MDSKEIKIIKRKINGYYQQDKKLFFTKDSIRPKNYIDVDDVVLLLKIQENKCYICGEKVLLTYEKGCKNQITLDRINNRNPHLKGNILVACWYCNCRSYNSGRCCSSSCCQEKSKEIKKKDHVPSENVMHLLDLYNIEMGTNYYPNDDWVDYEDNEDNEDYEYGVGNTKKAQSDYYNTYYTQLYISHIIHMQNNHVL